jgi:lipid II:glycine glycyltransferase (peptidoglycan interpeptide bridge formation enzyme)
MLVFEVAKWCSENGCKLLNLGGSHSSSDDLFRFKSGFSKNTAEYFISGVVHNQKVYDMLCKKRNADETNAANRFPAYR